MMPVASDWSRRLRQGFMSRRWAAAKLSLTTPVSLATLLGVTTAAWVVPTAIAPQVAQAYVARLDVVLDIGPDETFASLVRRAEAAARAAAQRSFDADILVSEVRVVITGEGAGRAAPILQLQVTRPQWRSRPNPQLWGTYFRSARKLLGFRRSVEPSPVDPAPVSAPAPATPTAPAAPPNVGVPPSAPVPPTPAGTSTPNTPPEELPNLEPVDLLEGV